MQVKKMRNLRARRFGVHKVKASKFKGCLHVSTEKYQRFCAELCYLHIYLNSRILPAEPEEVQIVGILLNLENILEHESEELIRYYVHNHPSEQNKQFKKRIDDGYISFECKFEWLHKKDIISQSERDIMEEIRNLRNAHAHIRPTKRRIRYKYFGKPLLTTASLRKLFIDVAVILKNIMTQSKRKHEWTIIPPGYTSEMNLI